jgi:hypothetical protein
MPKVQKEEVAMKYTTTAKIEAPTREADEPPCTPEQATQLAGYCPGEDFEKIRSLGTWQAAKVIAAIQRAEHHFHSDVLQAEEILTQKARRQTTGYAVLAGAMFGLLWPRK